RSYRKGSSVSCPVTCCPLDASGPASSRHGRQVYSKIRLDNGGHAEQFSPLGIAGFLLMLNQKEYFDLLDWLEDQQTPRPQPFFGRMKAAFGIANLLYVDAAVQSTGVRLHRIHHTLDPGATQAL